MTKQEAQKHQPHEWAQTIAEIREQYVFFRDNISHSNETLNLFIGYCGNLLEIVDSQAQRITEQAKEIERLKDRLRFEMQPNAKDGM